MSTQPCLNSTDVSKIEVLESDAGVLQRMVQGDQQAILILYDRYSKLAYTILFRVLRDQSMAEELVQDIFMQLWRKPEIHDPSRGTLRAWIAVVCRHRAIDELRKRRPEVDIDQTDLHVRATQEDDACVAQFIGTMQAEMRRMTDAERLILELAYFEGYTHTEISAKMGKPLGTVKTRIRNALGKLRDSMLEKAA